MLRFVLSQRFCASISVALCLLPVATAIAIDLPAGATVAPSARQLQVAPTAMRSFGPEQVTGEPNVAQAGDNGSAWASKLQDDRKEWLICEYEKPVMVKWVSIFETYNPGALYKLTVFNTKGEEVMAWEGEDPTPRDKAKGISIIPVRLDFPVQRLKLYFDSPAVPGWNEIDAVGLTDSEKNTQWAVRVEASTTYAQPTATPAMTRGRNWGPEQVEGKPDTPQAGDQQTAWASSTTDGQEEWLLCEYKEPSMPTQIVVHETYNPGAVFKITIFDKDGTESVAWEGEDPTPRDEARGISVFPMKLEMPITKIKVYIDSPAVPGYNEIDAVGLRSDGETQWASRVEASTIFGVTASPPVPPMMNTDAQRIQKLEKEVEELTKQLKEFNSLQDEIRKLKEQLKKQEPPKKSGSD